MQSMHAFIINCARLDSFAKRPMMVGNGERLERREGESEGCICKCATFSVDCTEFNCCLVVARREDDGAILRASGAPLFPSLSSSMSINARSSQAWNKLIHF